MQEIENDNLLKFIL